MFDGVFNMCNIGNYNFTIWYIYDNPYVRELLMNDNRTSQLKELATMLQDMASVIHGSGAGIMELEVSEVTSVIDQSEFDEITESDIYRLINDMEFYVELISMH